MTSTPTQGASTVPATGPTHRTADFETYLAGRRSTLEARVSAVGDPGAGVVLRHRNGARFVFLLPDMTEPGQWRMQRFDERGFSGHGIYSSGRALVEAAIGEGFTERDDGALDRLAATPAFQRGNFLADLVGLVNRRLITMAEADERVKAYDEALLAQPVYGHRDW